MSNTKSPAVAWRQIHLPDDLPGLVHVGEIVHPSLPESPAVFTERATLFPEGCLVLVESETEPAAPSTSTSSDSETTPRKTGTIHGYAISHPIPQDQPPKLDSLLGSIPSANSPDGAQYYIHDVAILPAFRGQGFADKCIRQLLDVARRHGYKSTVLISVYGTCAFWDRYGFLPHENLSDALINEKLKGYGEDAVYLIRTEREAEAPRPTT